jgi:hypothetical protein
MLAAWGLKSRALVVGLFVGNDFQGLAGKDISELLLASFAGAAEPYTWRSFLALQRGALHHRQRTRKMAQERAVPT